MSQTIIVPIDGSPSSLEALSFAIEHAKFFQDKIILLNVQPKYVGLQNESTVGDLEVKKLQETKGYDVLEHAIHLLNQEQVTFEAKVRIGIATIEITSEAKEQNARMIILGSKGNGPVVSAVLGSVTYGVLHLASCPVTIVPLKNN